MIELVRQISSKGINEELMCTKEEYNQLIEELYNQDAFLQKKYPDFSAVPSIYSLYGVKITKI
jgi:hypothetical protein